MRRTGRWASRWPGLLLALACSRPEPTLPPSPRSASLAVRVEGGGTVRAVLLGRAAERFEQARGEVAPGKAWRASLPQGDYRIVAWAPGRAREVRDVVLWQGATEVKMVLEPEAAFSGRVTDGAGPVGGARIVAEQQGEATEVRAGPEGAFHVEGLRSGVVTLRVTAPGHLSMEMDALAPDKDLPVRLERLFRVSGSVREEGRPHPATVRVGGGGLQPLVVETDAGGSYTVDLPQGVYGLRAEAPGLVSVTTENVKVQESPRRQDLDLVPAADLVGRITGENAAPVTDAVVALHASVSAALPVRAATDARGHFRLGPLPKGRYRVDVAAPGYLPAVLGPVDLAPPAEGRVSGSLSRGATLVGEVVDARGFWLDGARIEVRIAGPDGQPRVFSQTSAMPQAPQWIARGELGVTRGRVPWLSEAASPGRDYVSGQRGTFRISGLPAGPASVRATHPAFAEGQSAAVKLCDQAVAQVRLVLRQGAEVVGRVVDEDGYPLPRALVRATSTADDDRIYRTAVADGRGDYLLTGVLGEVKIEAELKGYLPGSRTTVGVEDGRVDRFDLTLLPARLSLKGRIVDEEGWPVATATLRVQPPVGPVRSVRTDAQGDFAIAGLGAGAHELLVTHPSFPPLHAVAHPEQSETADLVMPLGGGIAGFVRDAHTMTPPAKFEARCGAVSASGRKGEFSLRSLAAGRCTLEVLAPGYRPWRQSVSVPRGRRPGEITLSNLLAELELQ